MRCNSLLFAATLNLVFLRPATAAELYVSSSGSDATSCTQAQPCREIRRALTLVHAGDYINVADGSYKGFTVSNLNGTAQARITIRAQGSDARILPTTDRSSAENRDNIYLTFSNFIVIDGFRTSNAPRAGMRIDASHFATVRNCVFGNNGTWGLFTNHSNNPLIENNEMYGSVVEHGIYISNSGDNPTLRKNIVHDNNANGIHMNGDLSAGSHGGVVGDGVISGALVEANVIYGNGRAGGSGINMDGIQDSVVQNNLLYNNHASGINAYQIDGGQGPRNVKILHNTIDMPSDGRYAVQVSETTGLITIRNNILYNRNSGRGGLAIGTAADIPNVNSDYNMFGGAAVVALEDWTVRYPLSAWQSQGHELHSLTATSAVLFQNAVTFDYHLPSGSPAIDSGELIPTVTLDREANSRPSGPGVDIGAHEVVQGTASLPAPSNLRIVLQ